MHKGLMISEIEKSAKCVIRMGVDKVLLSAIVSLLAVTGAATKPRRQRNEEMHVPDDRTCHCFGRGGVRNNDRVHEIAQPGHRPTEDGR